MQANPESGAEQQESEASQNGADSKDINQGDGAEQIDNHSEPMSAEDKIAALELVTKESQNKYLYLYAEFENYKKRSIKEIADVRKFGWEPLARELVDVVDNLERSLSFAKADQGSLGEGIKMVLSQLIHTLSKFGVVAIDVLGKPFDANLHEAIETVASSEPSGNVIKVHTTGYTIHGRLLRPARVAISKGPEN